ncbi:hypothetical protein F1737_03245 [Methanoplanus sp. FWC-SCC4]|uniref:Uncharacterized protein n=1 Tax=Methanochimaera problematica TaxID=2609417 RepID=A0AA97FBD4_9EURY|nr:hypothetical protein [Methanoplanus sp. FWC-SCC4]WOF15777.1 hypothetical protein F1737_03245 [Methanoplanus sp. FWC-SCC4]
MKKKGTKKDTDWQKTLSRAFIVFILVSCVVGFSLTFSFFSVFKKAEKGNYVIVDYTLSYEDGAPIISSSQAVVQNAYKNGYPVALTQPLVLQVGALQEEKIIPVETYIYPDGMKQYALFDLELNTISADIEGMGQNDVKKINLDFAPTLTTNMSGTVYDAIGGNFSEAQVGMIVPLAFSYNPELSENETDTNTSVKLERPSIITEKTDDTLILRYGYAVADVQIKEIR